MSNNKNTLSPLEQELLTALRCLLDEAVYTAKHESPGEELSGYLQSVRGTVRPAIAKAEQSVALDGIGTEDVECYDVLKAQRDWLLKELDHTEDVDDGSDGPTPNTSMQILTWFEQKWPGHRKEVESW